MKEAFFDLVQALTRGLRAGEVLLCSLAAERSDFVRFNRGRVRQPGSVEQRYLSLRLVHERRQASATLAIEGGSGDLSHARAALERLREAVSQLPHDPWLLVAEEPRSTARERRGTLAPAEAVVRRVVDHASGHDFVALYAAGTIYRGFANSYGQRNWHEIDSFNLDWSLHLEADKAVKSGYAGFDWNESEFEAKLASSKEELALLTRPRRTITPGEYRAYLTPRALEEVAGMMSWGGFSARARATRQSPLLRMEHGAPLAKCITLLEHTAQGLAPEFQDEGFVKPPCVTLIDRGKLRHTLVSPRSAKEYGLETNGAGAGEAPEALDMAGGGLPMADALAALDTGLYIGNLWYLNYSDRPAARVTGMTRFATFWVQSGRIVAPVNSLRFDDTIYRMLGTNLVDLTVERELLLDAATYDARSSRSMRLPGALLRALKFTL